MLPCTFCWQSLSHNKEKHVLYKGNVMRWLLEMSRNRNFLLHKGKELCIQSDVTSRLIQCDKISGMTLWQQRKWLRPLVTPVHRALCGYGESHGGHHAMPGVFLSRLPAWRPYPLQLTPMRCHIRRPTRPTLRPKRLCTQPVPPENAERASCPHRCCPAPLTCPQCV